MTQWTPTDGSVPRAAAGVLVAATVERRAIGEAHVRRSWNRRQPSDELVIECGQRIPPHAVQVEPHREHLLGVESRTDAEKLGEAADHESRAGQQDHRQRDLEDREKIATRQAARSDEP